MRIALADQSRTILRIVTDLIRADGHEVLGFTDARRALSAVGADSGIRALVSSVQLESLSGIKLSGSAIVIAGSLARAPAPAISTAPTRHQHASECA